jgi:microsomal dipeptidase-like Zn-dependent dipeptidase
VTPSGREWESFLPQARALHQRLPVTVPYFEYYGYDSLFKERGAAQCDLEKLDAAHVRVFGIALANGGAGYFQIGPNEYLPAGDADWAFDRLLRNFDAARETVQKCPRVQVVRTTRDLPGLGDRPSATGNSIHVIPLVTSHTWMVNLEAVDEMFRRGLRISHCAGLICNTWNRSFPPTKVNGHEAPVFTELGRELVARMNELGIVLDMAHMSDESTEAILAASSKPVMDGHTGSRTIIPHSRGHSDATLRKIAQSGGVAGIHFADHLFTPKVWGTKYSTGQPKSDPLWQYNRWLLAKTADPDERMRLRKSRAEQEKFYRDHNLTPPPPASTERIATLADMADHIEHMVNVMGIEHVGLGGDVNGITAHSWPLGCDHVGELPHLTAELLRRGWRAEHLEKFLSANWLRVFRDCLPP